MSTSALVGGTRNNLTQTQRIYMDGYPTHTGPAIAALVSARGRDAALDALLDSGPWTYLRTTRPPETHLYADLAYRDGVGVYEPATADFHPIPPWWSTEIEWSYLLSDTHLTVSNEPDSVNATIALDDLPDMTSREAWIAVECGPAWERCPHRAATHLENLPGDSGHLGMRQYLGLEPLLPSQASAVVLGARRITLSGGGGSSPYGAQVVVLPPRMTRRALSALTGSARPFYALGKSPGGRKCTVLVSLDDQPLEGVEYIYPPLAPAAGE